MTKFKVVLADDHQFLLEGIMMLLKDDPKIDIVATAINGIELMTTVAREKPALVILDLNMPGYDGLQCLEKIKKISRGPGSWFLQIMANPNWLKK